MTRRTARTLACALALATGCLDQTDDGSAWVDATRITGELAPELGAAPVPLGEPPCTVRVASWNVELGEDPDALARELEASTEIARADVLLVQEIEAYVDEPGSRASRLAAALGMAWVYAPARPEEGGTHGLAILSRHPLERARIRQLPFFEQPVNSRQRIAMSADVVLGAHRLEVVNVHLDVRLGPVDRVAQLHPAVNDIATRVVVGGDFNTNPWAWFDGLVPLIGTEAIVGQEQALVIDDYLAGKGMTSAIPVDVPTMRLPGLGMRIDNLYARAVPIVGAGVEHVDGSDHWPLWIDVDVCR